MNIFPKPMRLAPRILLLVVPVASILVIAIGIIATKVIEYRFAAQVTNELRREADFVALQIETALRGLSREMKTVAANDLLINGLIDDEASRNYLPIYFKELSFGVPGVSGRVTLADYRGRTIVSNRKGRSHADQPWLKRLIENGADVVSIGPQGFILAAPVNYQGRPEGALIAEYSHTNASALFSTIKHIGAAVISYGDRIVYAPNEIFRNKIIEGQIDRGSWLVFERRVSSYPEFRISLYRSKQTALGVVHQIERFLYAVIALFLTALVIAIVLAVYLTTSPLKAFATKIKSIVQMEDIEQGVSPGKAVEIEELAQSFTSMMQRLRKTVVSQERLLEENAHRRRVEGALREREARSRAIFDSVLEGIITIDAHGCIDTFNPAATEIFGYSATEVIGRNVSVLMPEPIANEHDQYISKYIQTGEANIIGQGREVRGRRKDGSTFPMDLVVTPMSINGGVMFTGIVRDITEQKLSEELKKDFIAMVSHELRTPLTSLAGSVALIQSLSRGELSQRTSSLIDIAQRNCDRLKLLVNDILDIEKIEAGRMEYEFAKTEMVDLVRQAIGECESYSHDLGIEIKYIQDVAELICHIDPNRVVQILHNLISNAIKYSPEDGEVIVHLQQRADCARISVSDTGPGIEPGMQERIFDKFQQLGRNETQKIPGTGLGLSISQAIAKAHGSAIQLESSVGLGSTFYFDLEVIGRAAGSKSAA